MIIKARYARIKAVNVDPGGGSVSRIPATRKEPAPLVFRDNG